MSRRKVRVRHKQKGLTIIGLERMASLMIVIGDGMRTMQSHGRDHGKPVRRSGSTVDCRSWWQRNSPFLTGQSRWHDSTGSLWDQL